MTNFIELAVLTKSSKWNNLCVAGIDWNTGKFVRLVTDDATIHGAVEADDFKYQNGEPVNCLDLIKVAVLDNQKDELQPENVLLDLANKEIELIRKVTFNEVLEKHPAESDAYIFKNIVDEGREDKKDRLTKTDVLDVGKSLVLVKIDKMEISKQYDHVNDYQKRSKAAIQYKNVSYKLTVTDPVYEYSEGEYSDIYAVISIGTEFKSYYYKLVAAIYEDCAEYEQYTDNKENNYEVDEKILSCLKNNGTDDVNKKLNEECSLDGASLIKLLNYYYETQQNEFDDEAMKVLDMEKDYKIENLGYWFKNLQLEIEALDRTKRMAKKRQEEIKRFLFDFLEQNSYNGEKVRMNYTTTISLEFDNKYINDVPMEYLRVDKNELKKAVKNGLDIPGCKLSEKKSLSISLKK